MITILIPPALSVHRRAAAKRALFAGSSEEEEDVVFTGTSNVGGYFSGLVRSFNHWLVRKGPLAGDVRTIQARFGDSVASYFLFCRWLVWCYLLAALPAAVWLVTHCIRLISDGAFTFWIIGVIPTFMVYSSFDSQESLTFVSMVVLVVLLQATVTLIKWLVEDRLRCELDALEEDQKHVQFARTFLVGWDNNTAKGHEVEELRCSNGMQLAVLLAEDTAAKTTASRTLRQKALLFVRRCLGMVVYMALQLAAWYAIVLLTASSRALATWILNELAAVSWLKGFTSTLAVSIVPVGVTIINTIMPVFIKLITDIEQWDSAKTITYMLVTRMYLAKILNACIQAASYMLLANPYLISRIDTNLRRNVEQGYDSTSFECRIDQASSGLFQLVVTEFVLSPIIAAASLLAAKLQAKVSSKAFVKPEFEVAKNMVSLLYFQALILASFPFFPMSPIFVTLFMFIR
ncbi:hypothetical protein JKP88DRAFT_176300 [Tribonema minus]|uniref:Uncharacterized protein n=1 Tax=Tribonema minus TaxID=303371 RepID=A0A835ZA44_9STRA|nr:hypothetical protein JKP88DRAFT_176300 [Tribonema minus]